MRRSGCGQPPALLSRWCTVSIPDDPERRTRPIPRGSSRRQFLSRAMLLAAGAPSLGAFLEACATSSSGGSATGRNSVLKLASPQNPVTWPIASDNRPIANGLAPEKGATLRLYNYDQYIGPQVVKAFEKEYDCKVTVSTFNDTDEAITKIRRGGVPFDIYFPSYDQISRLVTAKLVRPLNHSYISTISNVWPTFSNPWYDQQWRYTTPYSVYTTGVGWRHDKVPADIGAMANPYDVLWDPKYHGQTALIDDWHTAMGFVLLRNGKTDLNTSKASDLALINKQLGDLEKA